MAIPINNKTKETIKSVDTWILGSKYAANRKADIRRHTQSIIRITYRSNFPPLAPYHFTSDAGWGCMLRSAQMLMAQALLRHLLGREWRAPEDLDVLRGYADYCNILKWFTDYAGPPSVYSIHHLVQCGMRYDKLPGEWYGPGTAALVLRDLAKLHHRKYRGPLEVFVCQGDTIYISEVYKFMKGATEISHKDRERERLYELGLSPSGMNYAGSSQYTDDSLSVLSYSFDNVTTTNHHPSTDNGVGVSFSDSNEENQPLHDSNSDSLEEDMRSPESKNNISDKESTQNTTMNQNSRASPNQNTDVKVDLDINMKPVSDPNNVQLDENGICFRISASESESEPTLTSSPVSYPTLGTNNTPLDVGGQIVGGIAAAVITEDSDTGAASLATLSPDLPSSSPPLPPLSDTAEIPHEPSGRHVEEDSKEGEGQPDQISMVVSSPNSNRNCDEQPDVLNRNPVTGDSSSISDVDGDSGTGPIEGFGEGGGGRVHSPFYDPLLNPPPSAQLNQEQAWTCGLMLMIPLRLGISQVNSEYYQELKDVLESRYSLGILGGRPKHAMYFVGHRGDLLLGLDPHIVCVNPSLRPPFPSDEYINQAHVSEFQCLDLSMLDPSIALAFYFRNRMEFETFCDSTRVSVETKRQAGRRSLFTIQHSKPSYESTGDGDWGQGHSDGEGSGDDDDYVFL